MAHITWIPEKEAATMVGRKPRGLRSKAKSGAWPITYTAPDGRGFQYSKQDIEKFLLANSTAIGKGLQN